MRWGIPRRWPARSGRGIRAGLEELSAVILGEDPRMAERLGRYMDVALPGHPYIKAAIDIASG